MINQVDLIVNVNSKHSFIRISELHIYNLIASVAPVLNVCMLDMQPHYRALARVANISIANLVIKELHGSSSELGIVWVSLAEAGQELLAPRKIRNCGLDLEKENIKYKEPKSASQIFKNPLWTPFSGARQALKGSFANNTPVASTFLSKVDSDTSKSPTKPEIIEIKHGNTPLSLNINHGNITSHSTATVTNTGSDIRLCITHESTAQLVEKKVLKAFRRFGRVISMSFDQKRNEWTLEYSSAKEVNKVSKVLTNNKLFGYRLASHNAYISCSTEKILPILERKQRSASTVADNFFNEDVDVRRSSVRIDVMDSTLTSENVLFIVASIHVPVQMSFGYDAERGINICIAHFNLMHQAAEVLVTLGQKHEQLCCRLSY